MRVTVVILAVLALHISCIYGRPAEQRGGDRNKNSNSPPEYKKTPSLQGEERPEPQLPNSNGKTERPPKETRPPPPQEEIGQDSHKESRLFSPARPHGGNGQTPLPTRQDGNEKSQSLTPQVENGRTQPASTQRDNSQTQPPFPTGQSGQTPPPPPEGQSLQN